MGFQFNPFSGHNRMQVLNPIGSPHVFVEGFQFNLSSGHDTIQVLNLLGSPHGFVEGFQFNPFSGHDTMQVLNLLGSPHGFVERFQLNPLSWHDTMQVLKHRPWILKSAFGTPEVTLTDRGPPRPYTLDLKSWNGCLESCSLSSGTFGLEPSAWKLRPGTFGLELST